MILLVFVTRCENKDSVSNISVLVVIKVGIATISSDMADIDAPPNHINQSK